MHAYVYISLGFSKAKKRDMNLAGWVGNKKQKSQSKHKSKGE